MAVATARETAHVHGLPAEEEEIGQHYTIVKQEEEMTTEKA
jgi:hypothetical protein